MGGKVFPSRRGEKGWCRFKGPVAGAELLLKLKGFEPLGRAPRGNHYRITCDDGEVFVVADRHFLYVLEALGIPNHWTGGVGVRGC